jgi:hypothetical protein
MIFSFGTGNWTNQKTNPSDAYWVSKPENDTHFEATYGPWDWWNTAWTVKTSANDQYVSPVWLVNSTVTLGLWDQGAGHDNSVRLWSIANNQFEAYDTVVGTVTLEGAAGGSELATVVRLTSGESYLIAFDTVSAFYKVMKRSSPISPPGCRFYQDTNALTYRSELPFFGVHQDALLTRDEDTVWVGSDAADAEAIVKGDSSDDYAAWTDSDAGTSSEEIKAIKKVQ